MNSEQLLQEAGIAIMNRPCAGTVSCDLGIAGGKVVCLPKYHTCQTFYKAIKLTPAQMNEGMSLDEWNIVKKRLWKLYKKLKLP